MRHDRVQLFDLEEAAMKHAAEVRPHHHHHHHPFNFPPDWLTSAAIAAFAGIALGAAVGMAIRMAGLRWTLARDRCARSRWWHGSIDPLAGVGAAAATVSAATIGLIDTSRAEERGGVEARQRTRAARALGAHGQSALGRSTPERHHIRG